MTRLLLALSLVTLTACKGSPFDPWGHTPIDECHPEKWLDVPQQTDSALVAYQAACKKAREEANSK